MQIPENFTEKEEKVKEKLETAFVISKVWQFAGLLWF